MYGMRPGPIDPHPELRAIVKPGTPRWLVSLQAGSGIPFVPGAGFAAAVMGAALIVALGNASPLSLGLGALTALAPICWLVVMSYQHRNDAVLGPRYGLGRVQISGEALDLLADIDVRFAYAERKVAEVPTGIRWSEVAADVQTVLWECAVHAAQVSELDESLVDLRYSEPGTPQAALGKQVQARRDEHLEVMHRFQRDADQLARLAGNAAAAARVALQVTGSMRELEIVTPSIDAQRAASNLDEAKARLTMLAQVWASLDTSTTLLAERLEAERDEH